jgi:hypothetical protein
LNVSKTIELPDGKIQFEGELEQQEADLVVKIGLSFLLQTGVLPIIAKEIPEEGGETIQ